MREVFEGRLGDFVVNWLNTVIKGINLVIDLAETLYKNSIVGRGLSLLGVDTSFEKYKLDMLKKEELIPGIEFICSKDVAELFLTYTEENQLIINF